MFRFSDGKKNSSRKAKKTMKKHDALESAEQSKFRELQAAQDVHRANKKQMAKEFDRKLKEKLDEL